MQAEVSDAETLAVYQRYRRAYGWDMWAQAAFAAEDLEMLITGLEAWRAQGGDAFPFIRDVDARGSEFFDREVAEWDTRIRALLRGPSRGQLEAVIDPAEASQFAAALEGSVAESAVALQSVARRIPWLGRQTTVRYKHGFLWFLPNAAPLPTNDVGYPVVKEAADGAGFLVLASENSAVVFTCSDQELSEAEDAIELCVALCQYITSTIVTEAENRAGPWGVGLFGSAADDLRTQAIEETLALSTAQP
jgi:hypothetical protein